MVVKKGDGSSAGSPVCPSRAACSAKGEYGDSLAAGVLLVIAARTCASRSRLAVSAAAAPRASRATGKGVPSACR